MAWQLKKYGNECTRRAASLKLESRHYSIIVLCIVTVEE